MSLEEYQKLAPLILGDPCYMIVCESMRQGIEIIPEDDEHAQVLVDLICEIRR